MSASGPPKARPARSNRHPLPARGVRGDDDFLVIGVGASAGGLDAARKLVEAVAASNGMAFILVQHLDPTHESMMVDLLAGHTSMTVRQATTGMPIERDHLYVIPPGAYLSVDNGALQLSEPQAHHGARLPFDFLLHSLAKAYGGRAVCVVLSGTGADGSLGLKAVKGQGGLVVAQDPDEASYDGMPRNAIKTGAVDLVLPVAKIPDALVKYDRRTALTCTENGLLAPDAVPGWVSEVIKLLRTRTAHDFRLYKEGTLQRRIERRTAMAAIEADDMDHYLDMLRSDARELDLLAKDLLINVTSFFRDPKVFDLLVETIVPDLIHGHPADQPLRIWTAGCSTGEEAYSLVMLFREASMAANSDIKLQVFASDVDPDAVASAREGVYAEAIAADVSPARLTRFFTKEDHSYRVLPELRATVVFAVQDVLADPPFSRLDLISCRNLLIYLRPEAQVKALSLFHFALREGGILLLGNSETLGNADHRFEVISEPGRLYRRIGRNRAGDHGLSLSGGAGMRTPTGAAQGWVLSRQTALAELCRRLVLETYAPAAVLINREYECLYYLGPTERYLRVPPGPPTLDLLAMMRRELRIKLRSAIQQASQQNRRIIVSGGSANAGDSTGLFAIEVRPVLHEGETLLLIAFVDEPLHEPKKDRPITPQEASRVSELERELEATRAELMEAIRSLEISNEQQRVINAEALSNNEEFQATNEELLTSKEELQSLNEELTALNTQLQETLEQQRTTFNDLQNVLYSTNVATLFLDTKFNIRFFTPATKSLFRIIPSDVGRPLADLRPLAADDALLSDAQAVLQNLTPLEREIEAERGTWYLRRILPYRTHDNAIEGVVITFVDISDRRHAADALEAARKEAQRANAGKSRFLAAASHDLRQPLQASSLIRGLLEKKVKENRTEEALALLARLEETAAAMSGTLDTLLDINQLEAGGVRAELVSFPIGRLFDRLQKEFVYQAEARGLALRVVRPRLSIYSDPRLLDQMVRNLLSNALKYTNRGRVLLGCRRRGSMVSIEVWDTGVGIPNDQLQAIFEEYHQLDNAAQERNRGLGLGLSIVKRLADLVGHRVRVRSHQGKGSVFTIEVMLPPRGAAHQIEGHEEDGDAAVRKAVRRTGTILVVEDDPEVRGPLALLLEQEGHRTLTAPDGIAALELVARDTVRPDLILADYNLPNGMNGLQVAAKLQEKLHRTIPAIILSGEISLGALRDLTQHHCMRLRKPVRGTELMLTIQNLLASSRSPVCEHAPNTVEPTDGPRPSIIYVVDDDSQVREGLRDVLEENGWDVATFATGEEFNESYSPRSDACLLLDAYLPGLSGLELLRRLREAGYRLPVIMITGDSDVPMAVEAMKAGAVDFIEKPVSRSELVSGVARALEQSRDSSKLIARREVAASRIASLTQRQRQIMEAVLAGHPSKNIAADLGISQRTVENHRAAIMKKTDAKSLPALARLALAATSNLSNEPPGQDGSPAPAAQRPASR